MTRSRGIELLIYLGVGLCVFHALIGYPLALVGLAGVVIGNRGRR